MALTTLWAGRLADKINRRYVIIGGLSGLLRARRRPLRGRHTPYSVPASFSLHGKQEIGRRDNGLTDGHVIRPGLRHLGW